MTLAHFRLLGTVIKLVFVLSDQTIYITSDAKHFRFGPEAAVYYKFSFS